MHFSNWIAVKYAPWFLVNFARDLSLSVYNSITRGNISNPNGLYIYFNPSNLLNRIIRDPLQGIVVGNLFSTRRFVASTFSKSPLKNRTT